MRLETPRLFLRPPIKDDFDAWAMMEADETVKANTGAPQDRRESWSQLLSIAGHWSLMGWGPLCAVERSSGRFVGRFGPSRPFNWPAVEIGWMLLPEFHGKGYALEGAIAAMDFAFGTLGEARVIHTIRPANLASQKLAAKLGSRNLGPITLPAPYAHVANDGWRQTRKEWAKNRARLLGVPADLVANAPPPDPADQQPEGNPR